MRKSSQRSHERKPKVRELSLIAGSTSSPAGARQRNYGLSSADAVNDYLDMSPVGDSPNIFSSEESILHARGYLRGRAM